MMMMMPRRWFTDETTISELFINEEKERQCFILEDTSRPGETKIPGKTCIPTGTYRVTVTYSPKFNRMMPLLIDVPGFTGVRIHWGNRAEDTSGCLVTGTTRSENAVGLSRKAYELLFVRINTANLRGENIGICIYDSPDDDHLKNSPAVKGTP